MPNDDLTLSDLQDRVRERAAAYLTIHSEVASPAALAGAIGLTPTTNGREATLGQTQASRSAQRRRVRVRFV